MKTREEKVYKDRRQATDALKQAIRLFDKDLRNEYINIRRRALDKVGGV